MKHPPTYRPHGRQSALDVSEQQIRKVCANLSHVVQELDGAESLDARAGIMSTVARDARMLAAASANLETAWWLEGVQ